MDGCKRALVRLEPISVEEEKSLGVPSLESQLGRLLPRQEFKHCKDYYSRQIQRLLTNRLNSVEREAQAVRQ